MKSLIIVTFALIVVFASCKKDNDDKPVPKKAYLSKVVYSTGTIITYTYNEDKKPVKGVLTKPDGSGTTTTYHYDGQGRIAYYINDETDPIYTDRKVVLDYNTNGDLEKLSYFIGTGFTTPESWYSYEYDADTITKTSFNSSGAPIYKSVIEFLPERRNITAIASYKITGTTETLIETSAYSNYDDKKSPYLNLPIELRVEGSENNYRNLKGTDVLTGEVSTYTYNYEYDAEGYVIKLLTDGSGVTYEYIYL